MNIDDVVLCIPLPSPLPCPLLKTLCACFPTSSIWGWTDWWLGGKTNWAVQSLLVVWLRYRKRKKMDKAHQPLVQCFFYRLMSNVLCQYYCIVFAFALAVCFVIIQCDWVVLMLQSSLVHVWEGLGMRLVTIWPWELFHLVLEQDQPSYSCSLIPRPSPTSSFDHLQYVNQMMASYPGPILSKHLGTIALFPTIAASSISQYQNIVGRVLGCLGTKANNTWTLLGLQQLRGCISIYVSSFHFQLRAGLIRTV